MKFLFLRGKIPQDRDPHEILYTDINKCDDMWTHLMYTMTKTDDYTELWYWGSRREFKVSPNFTERYVPNFKRFKPTFNPDVIIARGGFPEYDNILKHFPDAFKVYYGAGKRYMPTGFKKYNLILQDSEQQQQECQKRFSNSHVIKFIKPTVDHLFKPLNVKKEFDVCFIGNGSQEKIKGHGFVYKTSPPDLKILNLGNKPKLKLPKHITRKRVIRSQMAREIQRCKVGIVPYSSKFDSCPRVIPELLACGIPIVVLKGVRFWSDLYLNYRTGIFSNKEDFWKNVRYLLENTDKFDPSNFYELYLSLESASDYLRGLILHYLKKSLSSGTSQC